jgi:hypothetical protein
MASVDEPALADVESFVALYREHSNTCVSPISDYAAR